MRQLKRLHVGKPRAPFDIRFCVERHVPTPDNVLIHVISMSYLFSLSAGIDQHDMS